MTERRALSRRRYLARGGALGIAAFVGCLDDRFGGADVEEADENGDSTDGDGRAADADDSGGKGADSDEGGNDTDDETTTDADEEPDDDTEQEADDGSIHAGYETTRVRLTTPEGEELGSVTAAIADTPDLRYLGLSDTPDLPEDRGMLFVYDDEDDRTFVMREMDFGIDIVYADAAGVITEIHHAPEPGPDEDGEEPKHQYPGYGQYVLEVTYEWTADRGVEPGDVLEFEL